MNEQQAQRQQLLEQAEQAFDSGLVDRAEEKYRELLAADDSSIDGWFGLGTVLLQKNLHAAAARALSAALDRLRAGGTSGDGGIEALICSRIGLAHYQMASASAALGWWKQALALYPTGEVAGWVREVSQQSPSLVSVVIPTYNYARYLPETIASVFAQTHKNIQLIIINDASTDNTDEVIAELQQRYDFVYLKNEVNKERSASLNIAHQSVQGEFIISLDADDLLLPDAITLHLENLQQYPEAAFSYGAIDFLLSDGTTRPSEMPLHSGELFDLLFMGNFILPLSAMYRAAAWRATVGFNEKTTLQDWDIWLKLLRQGPARSMNKTVAHYRRHAESAHQNKNLKKIFRSRMVVLNDWKDEPLYDMAWMHKCMFHEKSLPDTVVEELVLEGEQDRYLDYRYAQMLSQRGNQGQAIEFCQRALDGLSPRSFMASPFWTLYLKLLKDAKRLFDAVAFIHAHVDDIPLQRGPAYCYAAAETLMDHFATSPVSKEGLDLVERLYLHCLDIGEASGRFRILYGTGSYLPCMQLGHLNVALRRLEQAQLYFQQAAAYGHMDGFIAYSQVQRSLGHFAAATGPAV